MLKFLIFIAFFAVPSFFLIEAYSLEVEIDKESERIIESLGWTNIEKMAFQEQIQIIIDHTNKKNRISVGLLTTDPSDIRFPDYIENITNEPKIISLMITNQFACAPMKIDRACVIIDVERAGLGDNIVEIRDNTRKITDRVTSGGVLLFNPQFDSVTLKPKTNHDGEKILVSRALYTINKQQTSDLFLPLSTMLVSSDIREAGGFFNHAVELAENDFSAFSIALIPRGDTILRSMQISLICSDALPEFVRCPENISQQVSRGEISPLDFIQAENVNRSEIFKDEFFPLNSIIHVMIFSQEDLQIKSSNSALMEKLNQLGDIQDSGWFFSSTSGKKIDGRYLFGSESSINKNDVIFSIGPNSGDAIKINEGGGCLIATATFGSEMAPQVQLLREIRDNTILQTKSGTDFMTGFNQFYYSFSPVVADYERENHVFKETVKITLTPLLTSLTLLQYVDIDSESEILGYGIGVILLNIGMYFIAPIIVIMKIKKRIQLND